MEHTSELEQMVNILAFAADVTRKLARGQKPADQESILQAADALESVAEQLIEVIFPQRAKTDAIRQRTEPT